MNYYIEQYYSIVGKSSAVWTYKFSSSNATTREAMGVHNYEVDYITEIIVY